MPFNLNRRSYQEACESCVPLPPVPEWPHLESERAWHVHIRAIEFDLDTLASSKTRADPLLVKVVIAISIVFTAS